MRRDCLAALLIPFVIATTRPVRAASDDPVALDKTLAKLSERVRHVETAFARTMADRDHTAFIRFISEEAVFVGASRVLRGRKAVAEGWKRFFSEPRAPFSWAPDRVEVLASGRLALSSGPVFDPEGRRIGTFNSVWRLDRDGVWRIVLDNGCPECECPPSGRNETPKDH